MQRGRNAIPDYQRATRQRNEGTRRAPASWGARVILGIALRRCMIDASILFGFARHATRGIYATGNARSLISCQRVATEKRL